MLGGHQTRIARGRGSWQLLKRAKDHLRIPVAWLAISAAVVSCSISRPHSDSGPSPLADFNGSFWGDSISDDGRRVKIAFNVERDGDKFTGTYRCSAGNANCRNQMNRGWVRGTIEGRSFRVSLPDTSWCLYTLGNFNSEVGDGDYSCYVNATLIERGTFKIKRSAVY